VIDAVLVLLVVLAAVYGLFRLARWYFRPPPTVASSTAWDTRYSVEAAQTVWWIYRDHTGSNGTRQREKQEITRIDSAAPNFDELFLQGEQLAQQRAFLLNSSLSR
jgi:hypothetical protein